MKPGEYQQMWAGLDQMVQAYQQLRDSGKPLHRRLHASERATRETNFTRRQLESMLVVAIERLTQ
jgi:hypothetical protein